MSRETLPTRFRRDARARDNLTKGQRCGQTLWSLLDWRLPAASHHGHGPPLFCLAVPARGSAHLDSSTFFGFWLHYAGVYATLHLPAGAFWTGGGLTASVRPPHAWKSDTEVLKFVKSVGCCALHWEIHRRLVLRAWRGAPRAGRLPGPAVELVWSFLEVEWKVEFCDDLCSFVCDDLHSFVRICNILGAGRKLPGVRSELEFGGDGDDLEDSGAYDQNGMTPWSRGDLDVMIVAKSDADASRIVQETRRRVCVLAKKSMYDTELDPGSVHLAEGLSKDVLVLKTPNTISIVGSYPCRMVQIILKYVSSVRWLILFADLDCTALAYDGLWHLYGMQRSVDAIRLSWNYIPGQMLVNRADTPARIAKYVLRGFGSVFSDDTPEVRNTEKGRLAWQHMCDCLRHFRKKQNFMDTRCLRRPWLRDGDSHWELATNHFLTPRPHHPTNTRYDEVSLPRGWLVTPQFLRHFLREVEAFKSASLMMMKATELSPTDEVRVDPKSGEPLEKWADWGMLEASTLHTV